MQVKNGLGDTWNCVSFPSGVEVGQYDLYWMLKHRIATFTRRKQHFLAAYCSYFLHSHRRDTRRAVNQYFAMRQCVYSPVGSSKRLLFETHVYILQGSEWIADSCIGKEC